MAVSLLAIEFGVSNCLPDTQYFLLSPAGRKLAPAALVLPRRLFYLQPMTELEFQRAKRAHAQMVRASVWERVMSWAKGLCARSAKDARRAFLDRKAEVERKARQSI